MKYNINHIDGLFFEIVDDNGKNKEYTVTFLDENKKVMYETKLKPKGWARLDRKYLSDITIIVKHENGNPIKEIKLLDEIMGKKIFISFESKSLGDTLAWMPYCLEFKNKYKCRVVVSTFNNDLFENVYPEIQFVGRGKVVHELFGMFWIGWFWEKGREPAHPATIPLQQSATNILNLPFEEIIPRIDFKPKERPMVDRYVVIATHSTSQLKYWYYWQEVIDWLVDKGYKVVEMSLQPVDFKNLTVIEDKSMKNTMNVIYYSDFFIGLSSGLSWLAWALNKEVIMISNFTEDGHEFTNKCIRINDTSICNSCWNNPLFKFDKGSWFYCPEHEGTSRQFECHKEIKADKVIEAIDKITTKLSLPLVD